MLVIVAKCAMCPVSSCFNNALNKSFDIKLIRDDMSRLKYTTVFLKEVMRMHSTVPLISRWLTKPLVLDGVEIPSNLYVDILIQCINHHPDVWPDHMVCQSRVLGFIK